MGGGGRGGGGDGGAADRQAAEDARVAAAVKRVNEVFGITNATANPIDKAKYTKTVQSVASPIGIGGNQSDNPSLGNSFFAGGGKTGFLRRLSWVKPAPTPAEFSLA